MLTALGFLTIVGGARAPDARTLRWFPLIGAAIGAVLALAWVGAGELWPPAVAAVVVVAVDLAITGMLHVDGLADTADGVLPHLDRERRLEVMRSPDVGAFALAVVPTVLLARWSALATDRIEPLALVAVWAASRTAMATIPALVPYARDDGLASPFVAGSSRRIALWFVPCAALLAAVHEMTGAAALVAGLAIGAGVVALARRRVGGFTGDVLGAAGVLTETGALLVLAAR